MNPFALLALGCDKYIRFQQLLAVVAASSPGGMVDIVYYLDKATPGNERRWDNGRVAQCIYF